MIVIFALLFVVLVGAVVSADYVLGVLKRLWELHKKGLVVNTRVRVGSESNVFLSPYEGGIEVTYFYKYGKPPYRWRVRLVTKKPKVSEGLLYYVGEVFPYVEVLIDEGVYELLTWFEHVVSGCRSAFRNVWEVIDWRECEPRTIGYVRLEGCCDPDDSWVKLGPRGKHLIYRGEAVAYADDFDVDEFRDVVEKVMEWWRSGGKKEVEDFIAVSIRRPILYGLFP